ncbi:MAG: PorV/PorQ family protein [Elusimicrobia bacterium]|nr:PorV/PorQ family protein [Elusimicrobiota bacterium]
MITSRAAALSCAALLWAAPALAASYAGTASGSVLKLPAGARAAALGEAYAAGSVGDPASIYYNPASPAGTRLGAFSFSHAAWFQSVTYDLAAFTLPLGKNGSSGTLIGGAQYLNYGDIQSFDNTGTSDGSFSPHDFAGALGWAYQFENRLAVGAMAKYVNSVITRTASAFTFDLGARYPLGYGFTAGAAYQNAAGSLRYARDSAPLPRQTRLGLKWETPMFTFSSDMLLNSDGKNAASLGAEARPVSVGNVGVALRAGYNSRISDTRQDSSFPVSMGAGILSQTLSLDYAFVPYGDLGSAHLITVTLHWDQSSGPFSWLLGEDSPAQEPQPKKQRPRLSTPRQTLQQQEQQPQQQLRRKNPFGSADITTWE